MVQKRSNSTEMQVFKDQRGLVGQMAFYQLFAKGGG